jgi:hypothetical protein
MSQVIFQRLIDRAASGGTVISNSDKGRYIKRLSEEDAELMAKADVIDRRKITRLMRAVRFDHEGRRYFAFFGFASTQGPLPLPEGLTELDPTPGMFGIAITETDAMARATASQIREIIEADYHGLEGYEGHDLDAVAGLFPTATFAEADANYPYTENLDRVLGAMVAATYVDGPISLDEDTLKAVSSLFTTGPDTIPFDNVLQGVLSISWSGLYVELYRCIEQLYPVPRLADLIRQWASPQSFGALADLLREQLGWRPREDDSLNKLIAACPDKVWTDLIDAFDVKLDDKSMPAEIAGRQVYAMRNGLVHFRGNTTIAPPSDEKWNAIVMAMIALVTETYDRFGQQFHNGVVVPVVQAVAVANPAAPTAP